MPNEFTAVAPVSLPAQSGIAHVYPSVHLADAFEISLPADATRDPDTLARFIFAEQPAWVGFLLGLRDAIVARLGLKTTRQLGTLAATAKAERVGIFRIYSSTPTEIVLGEDDKHLDFRLSLLCTGVPAPEGKHRLTLSTVVHCHNLTGRIYILIIAPFHRMVVKASLRRAAHVGWPLANAARSGN